MQVSAQISLNPLKQQALAPAIEMAWKVLEESQFNLKKGDMSTFVIGEAEVVFGAIKEAFLRTAEIGPVSMVVTLSNACPV